MKKINKSKKDKNEVKKNDVEKMGSIENTKKVIKKREVKE